MVCITLGFIDTERETGDLENNTERGGGGT